MNLLSLTVLDQSSRAKGAAAGTMLPGAPSLSDMVIKWPGLEKCSDQRAQSHSPDCSPVTDTPGVLCSVSFSTSSEEQKLQQDSGLTKHPGLGAKGGRWQERLTPPGPHPPSMSLLPESQLLCPLRPPAGHWAVPVAEE